MKINHDKIRSGLKFIGIAIFLVSVFFKLKELFIYGGKREEDASLNKAEENDEEEFEEAPEPEPIYPVESRKVMYNGDEE